MPVRITFIIITNASEKRLIEVSQNPVPIGRVLDPQQQEPPPPSSTGTSSSTGPSHLRFNSKVVSRNHARVLEKDGKVYIQDTKSSSGTFLNGVRISDPGLESELRELKNGDIVRLGEDYNLDGVIHQAIVLKVMFPTAKSHVDQTLQLEARHPLNLDAPTVYAEDDVPLRSGSQQSATNIAGILHEAGDVAEADIESEFHGIWRSLVQDIPGPMERLRRIQNQMQSHSQSSSSSVSRAAAAKLEVNNSSGSVSSTGSFTSPLTATGNHPTSSGRGSPVTSGKVFAGNDSSLPKINVERHYHHHSPLLMTKEKEGTTAGKIMSNLIRKLSRERIATAPGAAASSTGMLPSGSGVSDLSGNLSVDSLLLPSTTSSSSGVHRSGAEVRSSNRTGFNHSFQPDCNNSVPVLNARSTPQLDGFRKDQTISPSPASFSSSSVAHASAATTTTVISSSVSQPETFANDPAAASSDASLNSSSASMSNSVSVPVEKSSRRPNYSYSSSSPAGSKMPQMWTDGTTEGGASSGLAAGGRSTKGGGGTSDRPSVEECLKFIEAIGSWPNATIQSRLLELAKQQDESVLSFCTKFRHYPKTFVDVASQYAISKS